MKKSNILSLLFVLLTSSWAWAGDVVTGNNSQGTINVSDVNQGQSWTQLDAGDAWIVNMEVENTTGASFNEWGSSILTTGGDAFPSKNSFNGLQIYLHSSSHGGKLNAVFGGGDHLIDNVTYMGNFSATITYDGDKALTITTTNASSQTVTKNYTLTTALPAISQFAYGLPTGINIKTLTVEKLSDEVTLNTQGTLLSDRYSYTSPVVHYAGRKNVLRFDLTNSGAYYKNGKNRMSLATFNLYKADGSRVPLEAGWFSGNYSKPYANMLDGNLSTYCAGGWDSADQGHDYFEIALPEDVDLGGAYSFDFKTENTTMRPNEMRVTLSWVDPTPVVPALVYTFNIDAPSGSNVTARYGTTVLTGGEKYTEYTYDPDLFTGTEVDGYYWRVITDREAATITLRYTAASEDINPRAVVDLVKRIGGEPAADRFRFVLNPALSSKAEKFVIGQQDGRVLIEGSTLSALTTGLGWYLSNIAHINISWNLLNEKQEGEAYADLSVLPLPTTSEEHICDAQYRYYLNYCTFGYSMTTWTWKRWQQEIDWMALHGINMPLQIVGLEEVWRRFLTLEEGGQRKYGYTDAEAKAFVAGPAYTAWWGMNNLEGWGGTSTNGDGGVQDDAWYIRQYDLAQLILERQRELGIEPVLPGFSGMVPHDFTAKTGVPTDNNGGSWCQFTRPHIIDPTDARFADIAADYYKCLAEVMGESRYYSMDPFHEGGSISSGMYSEAYRAVFDAMERAKDGAQWVIQQWQWSASQKLSLDAVPMGRLVVLDLFSDGQPAFSRYNGYAPQHAVFCALPNFGGRSGLMGRLTNLTNNYFSFKQQYQSIKGIGAAPEAIEQTPVTYDLIFQLPWMNGQKPDMQQWTATYADSRYGTTNETAREVWQLLRESVLNYGADGIQGPVEDVWAARPNLDASPASAWGVTLNNAASVYTPARRQMLIDATFKLLSIKNDLGLTAGSLQESNYLYDIVEMGGGVMADYAYSLLKGISEAKKAAGDSYANDATYCKRRDAFLTLIEDVDRFKGTNLNFRLGKWTQEARDAADEVNEATTATPDWYEHNNARTLITTWGDKVTSDNAPLHDYSYRSWQGLMKDVYLPRWQYYFDHGCQGCDYFYFEWNWAHGLTHSVGQTAKSGQRLQPSDSGYSYSREPEGNTIEEATQLFAKYLMPISVDGQTYYAYRMLDNDLSQKVTIVAQAGQTIDLSSYITTSDPVTITGDAIDGAQTDLTKVMIKSDATDGNHTATVALGDGTRLTIALVFNPPYCGTYRIRYYDNDRLNPLFIAYNEDKDNANNKGYKLIAQGTYNAKGGADEIFTIKPLSSGFSISAQGMYLRQPNLSGWEHVMFTENASEAGVYIAEPDGDYVKLRSTGSGKNYLNDYDKLIFGNDDSQKPALSTFEIGPVTTYNVSITSAGLATLCLPFNVVLPSGVKAYDLSLADVDDNDQNGTYNCVLRPIAGEGQTVKAGTPILLGGTQGTYPLTITMQQQGAVGSLPGSLLRGNFSAQTLVQGTDVKKYILRQPEHEPLGFYRMMTQGEMAPNKCWMEWQAPALSDVRGFVFNIGDETGVETPIASKSVNVVYNLKGQRLSRPTKGICIVGGKKVVY